MYQLSGIDEYVCQILQGGASLGSVHEVQQSPRVYGGASPCQHLRDLLAQHLLRVFTSSLCDQLVEYSRNDLNDTCIGLGKVKAKFNESWEIFESHPRSEMGTVTLQPVNSPPRRLSKVAMRSGPAPLFLAPKSNRRSSGSSPLLRAAVRYSGGSTLQEIVCC